MKITNKYNLPERIIRMLSLPRKPVEDRFSVTDLINEPLPRQLLLDKWDELVIDYADLLMPFQGIVMHHEYEKFAKDDEDVEHKIETPIDGVIVVGKADNYFDETILDVKQTKIWSPTYPSTIKKWTAQLNTYAWQRRILGQKVNKLLIDVWYKNWSITTKQYTKDYPKCAYEEIEGPMLRLWSFEEQEKYVKRQLEAHKDPTECSQEGKWSRIEVRKDGRKTPLKVCDTFDEARQWAEGYEKEKKIQTHTELSEPLNCKFFCRARSVCKFAKELK